MTTYRDRLTEDFDPDIGSVVGCALDRVGRSFTFYDIQKAVDYFKTNRQELDKMPLATRRDVIAKLFEDRA